MNKRIIGLHHVSMKCSSIEKYNEALTFYRDILGLEVIKQWAKGSLLDTGNGLVEIFNNGDIDYEKGVINHFALFTKDVDECIEVVKKAGYQVIMEPKDVEIASEPVYPIRVAFCKGPLGEEIEFFSER